MRFRYRDGDLKADGRPETVVAELPTGGHSTRDIVFTGDNKRMLVSVGSGSNDAEGMKGSASADKLALGASGGYERHRADVLSFSPDGTDAKIFATGIRNCVGLAVQPATGDVYCSTNERDGLGDNLVPDYVILQRINLGLMAILAELHATFDWRSLTEEIWPFTEREPTTRLGREEAEWVARLKA